MLIQLEHADKVAGVKQTRRALQDGRAKELFWPGTPIQA